MFWYVVFLIGPLLSVFYFSFSDATTIISPVTLVGPDNYRRVFADPLFWTSVENTALQLVIVIPLMVACGFMLGYYLYLKPPGVRILRMLFFTSALLSLAAKTMIFYAVLAPDGLLNQFLTFIGLPGLATNWLVDEHTVLGVIMATDLWTGMGFLAILFSAQLTSLGPETLEAAKLDGCGHWRTMWHVAFGTIQGFVGVITMVQFLWTLFLSAGSVMILTKGGPGHSSYTLSFLVWSKAFAENDIGYSQAVGVVLFVTGIVGVVIIRTVLRSRT